MADLHDNPYGAPLPPQGLDEQPQHAEQAPQQVPYQQPVPIQQEPYQPTGEVSYQKKSHGGRTFLLAFLGAAVAVIIGFGGFGVWQATSGAHNNASSHSQIGSNDSSTINANDDNQSLAEAVAKKALPSVVSIDVYTKQSGSSTYGFGTGNSKDSDTLTETSLGSGVVLTDDGYIITNYHVVADADALKVNISGEEHDAKVVGSDPSSDVAVVKVDNASGLTPVDVGDSDSLAIGEWVMSIGSPFGLEQSVSTGIVSATSRSQIMDNSNNSNQGRGESSGSPTIYPNMIQTDAAINPGNSGGALVDSDGKLIGINTLITSYSGNYSGVGFAIPVNYAVNIAQQIIDGKTPTHAQLGITLSTVNSQNAQRYGLAATSGAYVASVNSGSGADEAGIKEGDIITKFEDQTVKSASDLMLDVRSKNPGDKVTIEINRNGETKQLEVTLGSDESSQKVSPKQNSEPESLLNRLFGKGNSNSSGSSS